jgi:hypothetical protein
VRFRAAWQRQLERKGPKQASLFAACASAVGPLFWAALPFKLANDASQFLGPTILNRLLTVVAAQAAAANAVRRAAAVAAAAAAAAAGAAGAAGSVGVANATAAAGLAGFNGTAAAAAAAAASASAAAAAAAASDLPPWLAWADPLLNNGYCLALLLFVGTLLGVFADNQHFQRVMRAGFRLRSIMTAEVYRKVCA